MSENSNVWVFIEQRDGKPADVSFELLSKGRKLANTLNEKLVAVLLGYKVENIAKETFRFGADEVLLIDHEKLKYYLTLPYARVIIDLVTRLKPRVVIFGATHIGRDLAPRVASATRSGLTADCTDLQISDVRYLGKEYKNLLLQIRPAFGGNIIATIISPDSPTQMATVREGVMEKVEIPGYNEGKITRFEYKSDSIDEVIKIVEQCRSEKKVDLKSAQIIVAGGYGMCSRENFKILYELAHLLGGEVGGSRAAVDAGFIEHERQIGQTGVTVRPKLYIACGISGAIQHRAGMQEAKKIIAINTDPEAPIFDIAHYKIVGNAMEVIPMFIEVFKHKLR
ncbi:MAG: electron transfer flavoprotein subunit alpha/FixB family protein [Candidatus Marinimicrobia bacterium]|nr:electron transfer flavoprotein subunit alpha/FixB family protein [Candidatus Neomarinimicrobiota bacterium]